MTALERVTGALEAAGSRRLGEELWSCPVPSHADTDAPLHVIDGTPVTLECPLCRQGKVLGAIGLRLSDLDGGSGQACPEVDVGRVAELLPGADPKQAEDGDQPAAKRSQASTLVELAEAVGIDLFHTPSGDAYATITVGAHRETWLVRAKPFRRYLSRLFYEKHGKVPGSQAIQDAVGVLEGTALFQGVERPTSVRVAAADGSIYLDLGNPAWEMVEITAPGWRVVTEAPVRFRRPAGLGELPRPQRGGSLDALRTFCNVSDDDWPLLIGHLVAMVRPTGPYPVLNLLGGEGSAKTSTARALRDLVDPSAVGLRAEPRDMRDLAIAATNGHVVGFDNLSSLPSWLSDGLCRLATGGGFATRELYSDDQEALFSFQRPLILTGIEELAIRGDLLDRSILLYLPPIRNYRPEEEFWAVYRADRPWLLGALLDAVSVALANINTVRLERLPRMADFARWVHAAAPGLGLAAGDFAKAYGSNRDVANALAIEASPVAQAVLQLVRPGGAWTGTATDLLAALDGFVPEQGRRTRAWPKSPKGLSDRLRRAQASLARAGVAVRFERDMQRRWIELDWVGGRASSASSASSSSSAAITAGQRTDDHDEPMTHHDAPHDAPAARLPWSDAHDAHDAAPATQSEGDPGRWAQ